MFFSLAKETKPNFPNQYQLGELVLNTDNGWHTYSVGNKQVVYKGYADSGTLVLLLPDILAQNIPSLTGNFCAVVYDQEQKSITFKTDLYRGFPIYVDHNHEITNLVQYQKTIFTNFVLDVKQDLSFTENKFDVIGKINVSELTLNECVDQIADILDQRTQNFIRYSNSPIRVFLSGGVDSLLVYSYIQKHTDKYKVIDYGHVDYDKFWLLNFTNITKFWGYQQMHHWKESCILASGALGDEFTLRNPSTGNLFLLGNGTSIPEQLEKNPDCLHSEHFKKYQNTYFEQLSTHHKFTQKNKEWLHWNLCNMNLNDWQHWHLGNTLTWTPLKDIEIFKLLLRLPLESAIGQIMNSDISKLLIERNCPGLTKIISNKKNTENYMSNLVDFYENKKQ